MMLGGHPFYDDYDDQYYGSGNNNNRVLYERRRTAEEARRRAEIERYYRRVKELEEQDKLRERQEYMRMIRQRQEEKEEYTRRAQETEVMRRLEEEEEEEERRRQFLARMPRQHVDEKEDEPEQSRIVRGPDGRLYRVPVGLTRRDEPTVTKESPGKTNQKRSPEQHEQHHRIVRGPDESPYRVPASFIHNRGDALEETEAKSPRTRRLRTQAQRMQTPAVVETNENASPNLYDSSRPTAPTAEQEKPLLRKLSEKANKQKYGKKRVTIIVEDASDSETEDVFKSVWRNRRPSPGEWMEPVENFRSL
jgi:hypothetical protein